MRNDTATPKARAARAGWLAALLATLAVGCASTSPERQQITDSLEPLNRPLFRFNEAIDEHAFGPVARGYKSVTPEPVRVAFTNAERNLGFPARFVSHVGQLQLVEAGSELARFLLNSTLGIAGLLDPATEAGLAKHDADLGQMLARWHVPPGPYLMIPVFGPSNSRDAMTDLVAMMMNPLAWTTPAAPPVGALFAINRRAEADDKIRLAKESALDYYVFVRDAYVQRRAREIRGDYASRLHEDAANEPTTFPENLYDVPADEPSEATAAAR
ncbi:MAG: ABC transporter [Proteobacteria bacterium]|nr:MAG: ABC transporter [Pseudomonadota bacterium]